MPKKFSEDNKSVRVTGGESFNFDEFRERQKKDPYSDLRVKVIMKALPIPKQEEASKKNRATAKKAKKNKQGE